MGLISFIKGLFSNTIEIKEDISNHFVYFLPLSHYIKVNTTFIVNQGFTAVFVAGDKVCDVLDAGNHKLTNASLPVLFSKLKLNRPNKKGKLPKRFKCDIYFINLSDISTDFMGENPFIIKSYSFGKVKGFAEGMLDFRVVDAVKLIDFLLIDLPFIKNGKAISVLGGFAGDEVNKCLENSETKFRDIITHPEAIHKYLSQEMVDKMEYMGIKILDVDLTALRLNKKIQDKVNKFLKNQSDFKEQIEEFNMSKVSVMEDGEPEEVFVENVSQIDHGAKIQELDAKIVTDLKNISSKDKAKDILFNRSDPSILFNKSGVKTSAKVDTSWSSTPTLKQCKFCGATIEINSTICPKCGFRQEL